MSKTRASSGQIASAINFQGTQGIVLPVGTTLNRNPIPVAGEIRYNSTLGLFEGYTGSVWGTMGPYPFQKVDYFTGNGTTSSFVCDFAITTATDLLVSVNGIQIKAVTGFQVAGTGTVTFSQVPANAAEITIRSFSPLASVSVANGSVGRSQLATANTGTSGQVLSIDTSTGGLKYISLPVQNPTLGGDLTGTVSNAQIAANTVGITELKVSNGTIGQVLATDGAGNLSFVTIRALATLSTSTPVSPMLGTMWLNTETNVFSVYAGNSVWVSNSSTLSSGTVGISLPVQTANAGKYLTTDGTTATWAVIDPVEMAIMSQQFTATNNQTVFTCTSVYKVGSVDVYFNGAKLVPGVDYAAIDGNTITLTDLCLAGDHLDVQSYITSDVGIELLPARGGHSGQFLSTDGTDFTWTSTVYNSQLEHNSITINGATVLLGGTATIVTSVLPVQTGNTGSYLITDGTTATWAKVDALPAQSSNAGKYLTTNGAVAAWSNIAKELPTQTSNSGKYLITDGTTATWTSIDFSNVNYGTSTFTGNGATTTFAIGAGYNENNIMVFENGVAQTPTNDYYISGSNLVFTTAPVSGNSIQVRKMAQSIAGATLVSQVSWLIVSTGTTLISGFGYFVNTLATPVTVTLPATASLGDTIRINDLAGNFAVNNLTVARNGHKIQGALEDLLVAEEEASFGLVYSNPMFGWKLMEI